MISLSLVDVAVRDRGDSCSIYRFWAVRSDAAGP